jgi:lipoprotein-releasing system permease protein
VLIAGIGGIVGLLLGVGITLTQQHFGFIKMPNGNFLIENYPVELHISDLVAILAIFIVVAFGVSAVATSTMINSYKK